MDQSKYCINRPHGARMALYTDYACLLSPYQAKKTNCARVNKKVCACVHEGLYQLSPL